jgi:hypothetical protein
MEVDPLANIFIAITVSNFRRLNHEQRTKPEERDQEKACQDYEGKKGSEGRQESQIVDEPKALA